MANIEFTPDQKTAINSKGCDILVSAAAGSGKTAVLTRRVLNKITDSSTKADITDFLVVTFTVSAANDLKRKLSEGIREEMAKEGADVSRLRHQLLGLSRAKIATIDSFCKFIVSDCARELGLPSGMTLADEQETDALELEIMEETVESFYSESAEDSDFILLAETFSNARSDAELIPNLLKIHKHLINFPCPLEILDENISELEKILESKGKASPFESGVFSPVFTDISEKLDQACVLLSQALEMCELDEDSFTKYAPVISEDIERVQDLKGSLSSSYAAFKKALILFAPSRMPAIRGRSDEKLFEQIKELRTDAKELIASLGNDYRVDDESELFMQLEIHLRILRAINSVVKAFHTRLSEEKKERRIMNFSDMTHYAFSALIEEGSFSRKTGEFKKTAYAKSLSSAFSEILIDEYQDVNELQDIIFRAVSNSHNRFMVGDIKQSIYAFRGATPKIFEYYRDTFLPHPGESVVTSEPKTVFLQNNYRSDGCIIDFTNMVFSRLMNHESRKYVERDALVLSKKGDRSIPVELTIFETRPKLSEDDVSYEAEYIADTIAALVNSCEYGFGDIAVLARASSTLDKVKAALDVRGIPADSTGDAGFFEAREIMTLISFIKAVSNPTDDISLVSALSSLPFGFTPDELYEIRCLSKKSDFYFAFSRACEIEGKLGEKCRLFENFLNDARDFAGENSCDRVLWRIMEQINLFAEIEKLPDPKSRRENLISLYSMARSFCRGEKKSLGALCDYFDTLAKDSKTKSAKKQIPGAVHLMTFHGSKGLQFPVCFAAGLGHGMNKRDSYEKVVFSPFGPTYDLPYSSFCTHLQSYLKKSAAISVRDALIDEELRTLYVTLTRPETRLYITAECPLNYIKNAVFNSSLSEKAFAYTVKHAYSHIVMLAAALSKQPTLISVLEDEGKDFRRAEGDVFNASIYLEYNSPVTVVTKAEEAQVRTEVDTDALRLAMSKFTHSVTGELPYKLSVSDIKEGLLDSGEDSGRVEFIVSPQFVSGDKKPSPAFAGTSMHTFMQFCSFELESADDCRTEAERLVRDGYILKEHFDCLDFDKLASIFTSPLMAEIRKSPRVEREKRYTLIVDADRLVPSEEGRGDKVLLQGVVDCFFENENGGITLVDFKTDRVKSRDILLERHSEQLKLYAEALEEIISKKVERILIWSFELSSEIEVK